MPELDVENSIFSKRLVIVAGKGGVGRTTVAAALGVAFARRGKRTLIFQAGVKESLSHLFTVPPIGEQISPLRDRLWAVATNPKAALREYGLLTFRHETIARAVLENSLSRSLLRAIPGFDSFAMLGKMCWHATQQRDRHGGLAWDTVVFDAPATGHVVSMLGIPRAIHSAIAEGPLARDAAQMRWLFEDPQRTGVLLVTLAEEMPYSETLDLANRLQDELAICPSYAVVNRLYPDRFRSLSVPARVLDALLDSTTAASPATTTSPTTTTSTPTIAASLVARSQTIRSRWLVNERYLGKLRDNLGIPEIRLPFLFAPKLRQAEIDRLSLLIEDQVIG
ncbi:MAG: ArsA family ATPase [Pseudomonadota bacterium]